MSARRVFPRALLASFTAGAVAAGAAAAGPWIPAPGEYFSEFRASHLSATSAFDAGGERSALARGTRVSGRQLVSHNELGWKERVSFVLAVPVLSLTERQGLPARPGEAPLVRTVTGLSDLVLGLRLRLLDGATAAALEAAWKTPMGYEHDPAPSSFGGDREPRLGSGQQDVGLLLHLGTGIERVNTFLQVSGGYRHRLEEPLDEIVYAADVGAWLGPAVLVAGRYRGFRSIESNDVPGLEAEAQVAGPLVLYRVDDRLDAFAGSNVTVSGTNVPRVVEYYVGLAVKQTRLARLQGFLGGPRRP